jgi:hypothetical protein
MSSIDQAVATQLANIEKRTGKSLDELKAIVLSCKQNPATSKHTQIVAHLKQALSMGHGDANTLVHIALQSDGASLAAQQDAAGADLLDAIYVGAKAGLRPLHEALMARLHEFGEFEIAPKKTYLSLRRKKQFAMVGPATQTQIELGLNSKTLTGGERLKALPPGGMCNFKLRLSSADEIDAQLLDWIRSAYAEAS